jgi:Domain of Unknown Function (DUF1259)
MAHRTFRRRAAIALTAGAAALATAFTVTASAAGQPRSIDWNAVGRAIGQPLKTEAQDVHTAEWLRTDLHVVNAGVRENPGMELNAEASFHQTAPGKALMIGEVTLTGDEVNKAADTLQHGGVEITALHKHIQDETPRLWWMHYWALGDPVQIARTVHAALAQTKIPLNQTESGWWDFAHESRTDLAQLCGGSFLLIVGGGRYSVDARLQRGLAHSACILYRGTGLPSGCGCCRVAGTWSRRWPGLMCRSCARCRRTAW